MQCHGNRYREDGVVISDERSLGGSKGESFDSRNFGLVIGQYVEPEGSRTYRGMSTRHSVSPCITV